MNLNHKKGEVLVRLCVLSLLLARLVWPFSWFSEGKVFAVRGCRPLISSTLLQTLIQKAGGGYCWGAEGTHKTWIHFIAGFNCSFPAAGGGINAFLELDFSE
jgi:hypothetical protein